MFKKILCLALAVMMIMGVAAFAASAAETDDAAALGAEADVAATGDGQVIKYDNSVTNWAGPVKFYIYDPDAGELIAWGSKKLDGTDEGNNIWSKDISGYGMESGKKYCIIFQDGASGSQTYDLIMDDSCIGDTAKATGNNLENPVDSNKTAMEAKWANSSLGPRMQITSIGNVVGDTPLVEKTQMFADFLTNTLNNARTFSGKDDQKLLDDTAAALGLTKSDVEKALKDTGVTAEWSKDKSSLPDGDSGSSSGSGSNSGSSSGTSTTGGSSSGSSSGNTGAASNTQTGQSETVLFIMLGVMVLAAGVIFFVRKRERA